MTAIDDLKVGMWIAVTKLAEDQCEVTMWGGRRPITYGGEPLRVLSLSLPFICVTDGKRRFSLDARTVEVQKLNSRYVREMLQADTPVERCKRKRKRSVRDPLLCPRCRCGRLIQRATSKNGDVTWDWYCTECGFTQQFAPA